MSKQKDGDNSQTKQVEVDYKPTAKTDRMSEMLDRYNNLISRTFIDIPTLEEPWIEVGEKGRTLKLLISHQDKFVRRIFNRGSFDFGGRFYGGWWWHCPKEWRAKIFINDRATNEIDFSGQHAVMLYAERGISYWKEIGDDPYTIPQLSFVDDQTRTRKIAKSLFLMLINAGSAQEAYSAFRSKADKPEDRKLKNNQLAEVYDFLVKKHPLISDRLGSDAGVRLMSKDSDIAEYVLDACTDKNIPALCVHDSFIVPMWHEDFLIEKMREGFEAVMKVPLGDEGVGGIKESSEREEDLDAALMTWMPYENVPGQDQKIKNYVERIYPNKSSRYKKMWSLHKKWCVNL